MLFDSVPRRLPEGNRDEAALVPLGALLVGNGRETDSDGQPPQ